MGSSTVRMWQRRVSLISFRSDASVVDLVEARDPAHRFGEVQVLEARDVVGHPPHDHRHAPALAEDGDAVAARPRDGIRELSVVRPLEA